MSSEEPPSTEAPSQIQQPSDTPALPQYPEMIMSAIEALNEKEGSNKSAISKHIEDTYGELPEAHKTLLLHHLNKMKQSGELVFVKNNYMKPDPNTPPKRGRGRPPKAKDPSAPVSEPAALSTPRGRGRPPKVKDDSDPASPKAKAVTPGSGRPRGRPPKVAKTSPDGDAGTAATPKATTPASGERRGRGRPPKVKTPVAAPVGC